MVPFVQVAGFSGNSTNPDAIGIRYRADDGSEVYANRFATSTEDIAFGMAAGGKGNSYLVGRSNGDYFILGFNKTGAARFSPVSYDSGGPDEGRAISMGGAGLLYYTGVSNLDYLTSRSIETPSSSNPSGQVDDTKVGNISSGSYANLAADDQSYMVMTPAYPQSQFVPTVQMEFTGTADPVATEISLLFDGHASISGIRFRLEIQDRLSSNYVIVCDHAVTTSDGYSIVPIKDDPARFVNPTTGALKVRVTFYGGTSLNWTAYMDWLKWDTIGT